eukprot:8585379-Ditylum_brightwellii.AAC.1
MQADIADSTNEKIDTDENMVQEDGGEKDIEEARENEGIQEDMKDKDVDEAENTENCIETQGEEETETH